MKTPPSLRSSFSVPALALAFVCMVAFALLGFAELPGQGEIPGLTTNGAGHARPWQYSLALSPNLEVNLATGNLNVRVITSRFFRKGLTPREELVLYHNSRAATKAGDYTGGLALGGGWSTTVGSRLETVSTDRKRLTRSDGGEVLFEEQTGGSWKTLGGARFTLANTGGQWTVTSHDQWQSVYDPSGKLLLVRDPSGNENSLTWNGGRVERATEPSGRFTEFTYLANGNLDRVSSSGFPRNWPFQRDTNGRLAAVGEPYGGNVGFAYDSAGRVASFTDYAGRTWGFTYWPSGNKQGWLNVVTRPDGKTLSFNYVFSLNKVRTELTDVRGSLWKVEHDRKETPALLTFQTPLGKVWSFTYDNPRRLTEVKTPLGHSTLRTHDAAGNVLTVTDPDSVVTTYTYDTLNNLTSRSVDGDTIQFHYEDAQHPTRTTRIVEPPDDAGQTATTTLTYYGPSDGSPAGVWNGLISRLVDPLGCEVRFAYDENGAPEGVQEGPTTATGRLEYQFNLPGLQGFEFVDWGGMTYGPGFPARPALPSQIQGRLSYLGSTTFRWSGAPASENRALSVPIDTGAGFESSTVSMSYDFDEFGRPTGFDYFTDEPTLGSALRSFQQTYHDDAPEAPVACTAPDGDELESHRRADYAVTHQDSNGGGAGQIGLDVAYTDDAQVQSVTRGDGTSSHYTYLPSGRVDTLEHRSGATQLLLLDYAYDARGLPTGVTETSPSGTVVKVWVHDSRGRLTTETRAQSGQPTTEQRYTYDAAGNRATHASYVNGALVETNTYAYDHQAPLVYSSRNNRLIRVDRTNAAGTMLSKIFFFYENPFGNVSHIVRRAEGSTHYDATVLLYAADASPWLAWDESWDNFGAGPVNVARGDILETRQWHGSARVWRRRSGTTLALLAGAEWTADAGSASSIFRVGAGGAITPLELEFGGAQRLTSSGSSYDLADLVGSTRITSANGALSNQDYTAFGVRLSSGGSVPTFGFAGAYGVRQGFGGQALTSSNLVAMGYRWYSSEFGRFLMRDPISVSGGRNVYAFASSQPTYLVDPEGLAPHGGAYRGPPGVPEPPQQPVYIPPKPGEPEGVGLFSRYYFPMSRVPYFEDEFIGPPEAPPLPQEGDPDFVGPPCPPELRNPDFIGPPIPQPEV
jgi:RHS repeat-associated protein